LAVLSFATPGAAGRVIIVLADGLQLADFQPGAPLSTLTRQGALGLVNTTTNSARNPGWSCLALASGYPPTGSTAAESAYLAAESYAGAPAKAVYERRTGLPAQGEVLHLGLAPLLQGRKNETLLGDILQTAGLSTSVLGNSDRPHEPRRWAATIAMNKHGTVNYGLVGAGLILADPMAPYGQRSDWESLARESRRLLKLTDFLVVDTGDGTRLDEYSQYLLPGGWRTQRTAYLNRLGAYLHFLRDELDCYQDLLIMVSLRPAPAERAGGNTLAPAWLWGRGVEAETILTSATTRRPGLATLYDISATVLNHFGLPPGEGMIGRPCTFAKEDFQVLLATQQRAMNNMAVRSPLLQGYIILQILLLIAATGLLFLRSTGLAYMRFALLALAAVPLAFLAVPWWGGGELWQSVAITLLMVVGLTGIVLWFGRHHPLDPFLLLAGTTAGVLLIDVWMGARLVIDSPLGYATIGGARYYGIGNEYMGVLLGASICTGAGLMDRFARTSWFFPAALFGLVLITLATPTLGANFGGTLTAAVAFPYALIRIAHVQAKRPSLVFGSSKYALPVIVLTVASLAGGFMWLWDWQAGGASSHVGLLFHSLQTHGPQSLLDVIQRKLALNLKLIRWTIWSRVLLTSLACYALLVFRPVGLYRKIAERYPHLAAAFSTAAVAAILAMLVNDSGVVAGATTMIYTTPILIYLLLRQIRPLSASRDQDIISARD
jgi:hypothetical protein